MQTIMLAVVLTLASFQSQGDSPAEQYKKAFTKAIKDGHVNKLCQDMKGVWEQVEGTENFKLCRPEKGVLKIREGYVMALVAYTNPQTGTGNIMPKVYDCAGYRHFQDRYISYDSTGKITGYDPVALGGSWEALDPNSQGAAILEAACRK